jgi:hypothetical protein
MPKLSDAQIASYAKGVGLNNTQTAIAVAIAIAESGGNTTSHNPVPPDDSYGLWQINMLGSMGPSRRQQFGITSNEQLYDPAINAKAMHMLSNGGQNWRPWTTYTRGNYRAYLARGNAVAGVAGSTTSVPTETVGLSDSLDGISQFFALIRDKTFWVRFSIGLVGMALVGYGIIKMTGDNPLSGLSLVVVLLRRS